MAEMGEKLRKLVVESGKSQKEIAAFLGVATSTMNNYLSAKDPSFSTVEKICQACGVKTWHFLASIENDIPVDMLKVMELIFKLKKDDRSYVLSQMHASINYIHKAWIED